MATSDTPGVVFGNGSATYQAGNGNTIHYKKVNGIYYHAETPVGVVDALERARLCRQRVRLYYGETDLHKPDVGRDWLEENDVEGYVGNSIGPLKVPILVHNRRSHGGGALLDQCLVKIRWTSGGVLYQHTHYHTGQFTIREIGLAEVIHGENLREQGYTHSVDVNGKRHANFRSMKAARRYLHKMIG